MCMQQCSVCARPQLCVSCSAFLAAVCLWVASCACTAALSTAHKAAQRLKGAASCSSQWWYGPSSCGSCAAVGAVGKCAQLLLLACGVMDLPSKGRSCMQWVEWVWQVAFAAAMAIGMLQCCLPFLLQSCLSAVCRATCCVVQQQCPALNAPATPKQQSLVRLFRLRPL
jgi:hypothetical protein